MNNVETIIQSVRSQVENARLKGLRLATPFERDNGDPRHLFRSRNGGPLYASIEWFGDCLTTEDEERILESYAHAVIEQEKRSDYLARLKIAHDEHYAKWLNDPRNIPYRVPKETLEKYGILVEGN